MKSPGQKQPKREGLRFLGITKLEGMDIFAGSSLAIKGGMVGKYKIAVASGDMRKLATVIEKRIPSAKINSWGLEQTTIATSIEDALGRSAITLLARVYQVIVLGKQGPGRFDGKVNLHFVKYKRKKFVLYWWTIKKRLYLGACLPVLSPFAFLYNKGDLVHSH